VSEPPYNYEVALAQTPVDHRGTLIVMISPTFFLDRARLAELAFRHRMRSVCPVREFVEVGVSYPYTALPALAAELVAKGAVVIAATGDVASARAAQDASSTVPVVFTIGGDPVRFGLVKSLNRPGGHVTGILFNQNVLGAKRVELLREVAPNVSRVALLMNPTNPNVDVERMDAEAGARNLGLETVTLNARNAPEIDTAFEQLLGAKADGIITATDPIPLDRREQIVTFANRYKLPVVGFVRQFAAVGALLSYGPSISWMYRQAGEYVGQILKGTRPAEMPVMQPTKFELVVNLKTAKAFGLDVPDKLLAVADEVIE
jgi:putative tryptophan/tyrosine transport system substrate-binding protein